MLCRSAQREGATLDIWSKPCLYQTVSSKREGRLPLVQPHGYPEIPHQIPLNRHPWLFLLKKLIVMILNLNQPFLKLHTCIPVRILQYKVCFEDNESRGVRYFDGGSLCS